MVVAEGLSFSATAERLGIAQPTLSRWPVPFKKDDRRSDDAGDDRAHLSCYLPLRHLVTQLERAARHRAVREAIATRRPAKEVDPAS